MRRIPGTIRELSSTPPPYSWHNTLTQYDTRRMPGTIHCLSTAHPPCDTERERLRDSEARQRDRETERQRDRQRHTHRHTEGSRVQNGTCTPSPSKMATFASTSAIFSNVRACCQSTLWSRYHHVTVTFAPRYGHAAVTLPVLARYVPPARAGTKTYKYSTTRYKRSVPGIVYHHTPCQFRTSHSMHAGSYAISVPGSAYHVTCTGGRVL
eukprot:1670151-Rhodomonas_salina.1